MIIPRIKIGLGYFQLIRFTLSLFKKIPQEKQKELVKDFENKFSLGDWQQPGVVFNQCRTAFYFLLKNLNLKPGGEVIFTSLHVADFINIIRCAGFKPVLVDLDPETYAVDYQDLENKINDQTALICLTHLSGFATDMEKISEISKKHNVPFIEDCSQAYPVYYKRERLGRFGRAAIFSLSFLKPIGTMSGGMVLSQDKELLDKLRREQEKLVGTNRLILIKSVIKHLIVKTATQKLMFRFFVFPLLRLFPAPFDFFSSYQRTNKTVVLREKLPSKYFVKYCWQQAKLGLELLEKVQVKEEARKERAYWLHQNLTNPNIKKPRLLPDSRAAFWTFPVRVENTVHFKKYLARHGIDSSSYLLSAVADEPAFNQLNFKTPATSEIKRQSLLLPMYPQLSQREVEYAAKIINQYAP